MRGTSRTREQITLVGAVLSSSGGAMTTLIDAAGRRRSPTTMPGYHVGRPPRNKGLRYPADPPTVEEIVVRECAVRRTIVYA